jgi:hypothetical protein
VSESRGCSPTAGLSPLEAKQRDVVRRMSHGERFTDVEDAINLSGFSADEKAALWMLAWSYVPAGAQRREANAHLAALIGVTRPTSSARGRLRIVR